VRYRTPNIGDDHHLTGPGRSRYTLLRY